MSFRPEGPRVNERGRSHRNHGAHERDARTPAAPRASRRHSAAIAAHDALRRQKMKLQ